MEVLPGGCDESEPVSYQWVWELQEPNFRSRENSSSAKRSAAEKGKQTLNTDPTVIPVHEHVCSSALRLSQCCEQLARAQADLQVTIRDLTKTRKTYQEAEQTAQAVREKADMEAKYVVADLHVTGSDITCPIKQGRVFWCFLYFFFHGIVQCKVKTQPVPIAVQFEESEREGKSYTCPEQTQHIMIQCGLGYPAQNHKKQNQVNEKMYYKNYFSTENISDLVFRV